MVPQLRFGFDAVALVHAVHEHDGRRGDPGQGDPEQQGAADDHAPGGGLVLAHPTRVAQQPSARCPEVVTKRGRSAGARSTRFPCRADRLAPQKLMSRFARGCWQRKWGKE